MSTPILEMTDVKAYYGDQCIVQGVQMEMMEGDFTSIIGRNGMGKTTLIKAIMGLVKSTGSIKFMGKELMGLSPHQRAKLGIGYCPQGRRNFKSLTVEEHLTFCACKGVNGSDYWNLETIYELFPRLCERRKSMGTSLSGGEQQMLAIGRALSVNPTLLIMDEPSEGLAPTIIDVLVDVFNGPIRDHGMKLLLVEQDLNFCQRVTDVTNVMDTGKIVFKGSLKAIRSDEELSKKLLGIG